MPDTDSKSLMPPGLRWAGPLLAPLYGLGVKIHRASSSKKIAPIATICIGNLTVGGTGKTPAVIYFARELARRGRKPAILMRGYKAQGGDEAEEAKAALKDLDVPVILGSDRFQSALKAREMGRDVALLDDGFQHWRLARDLDIVLIDATDPFGGGAMIPAGRLREPVNGLARAKVVIVTRSNAIKKKPLAELMQKIEEIAPGISLNISKHLPSLLRVLNENDSTCSLEKLKGARVIAACGIGNPNAFKKSLVECGADILDFKAFDDHHGFNAADVALLTAQCLDKKADMIVVTEKDAVKLQALSLPATPHFLALQIEFRVEGEHLWKNVEDALKTGDARHAELNGSSGR